jgi:hypothetical protein
MQDNAIMQVSLIKKPLSVLNNKKICEVALNALNTYNNIMMLQNITRKLKNIKKCCNAIKKLKMNK